MNLYIATKNRGKLDEFRVIFADSDFTAQEFSEYADVVEGEASYSENASRKARALHAQLGAIGIQAAVVADDSGLEIEALGGAPGVLSARFGGELTWAARRGFVLEAMRDIQDARRAARFVCALTYIDADGALVAVQASIAGRIAQSERGAAGFGYDPIFIPDGYACSFAEFSSEMKNAISHRRRAVDALLQRLRG